eukprot:XP_001700102.1 predicted protein [Chlamydomonas reinhardtii]
MSGLKSEEFSSKDVTEKPHPNIYIQLEDCYDSHLDRELAGSRLLEAWAACMLAYAARATAGGPADGGTGTIFTISPCLFNRGVWDQYWSTGDLAAAPALQALLSLATVRNLASLDRGSSYGQAAAAAATGSEDGECGPPWTLIHPAAGQTASVSALLAGGGELALQVWQRILDRRLAAAATASSSVVGPAVAAGVAEDWARGPGSLPRPGLEQLRAQEAERRAELESRAAALTAQLRQARHLPAVVPTSERDTVKPIQKGYISVPLERAQHTLYTGDPALRLGPPGYRIHFTTTSVVMEAFVEEAPGMGYHCFVRPYVAARAVAAELRLRGVVLPAGLEKLLEEAPEAINDDDVSWMNKILRRAGKELMLPQPLPAQLALPPWNDAATSDVCIRLANAARAEWVKWAAQQSPSLITRDECPIDATMNARAACSAVDCALTAARLLARSAPPSVQARRAAVRRLRQLWRCYCAALEAALGLVQRGRGAEEATAAAQGKRLLPDKHFGTVWGILSVTALTSSGCYQRRAGGWQAKDEAGIDILWACEELHSTAVLVAAVLPQECAMAAQQGANGSAGPDGAEQPGRYRVPLAVESIAGLFGPDGPCPNPQWQADVREAFASAGAVAANAPQQELSPEQLQACASRAHAALQQQRDPQQTQAAAALLGWCLRYLRAKPQVF